MCLDRPTDFASKCFEAIEGYRNFATRCDFAKTAACGDTDLRFRLVDVDINPERCVHEHYGEGLGQEKHDSAMRSRLWRRLAFESRNIGHGQLRATASCRNEAMHQRRALKSKTRLYPMAFPPIGAG
jgi:hypothetical protein